MGWVSRVWKKIGIPSYERGEGGIRKEPNLEIVEKPKGKNIVYCKWVFTVKHKANNSSLQRYKV